MTIKKAYYYIFYKFLRLFEAFEQTKWLSDFKAGLVLYSLEIFFLISLKVYYIDFFNRNEEFEANSVQTIIPFISLLLVNYFAFLYNDKWKSYVEEFDNWPVKRNIIGTWVIVGIVAFVMINLILSFYIMSQIFAVKE